MSEVGQKIIEGLESALEIAQGKADPSTYRAHTIRVENVDIRAIRRRMGLSQTMFAEQFGFSVSTLRNWEQGKRKPDPAVRAYLRVIEKAPDTVRAALAG
ncbi:MULTISPECIES: helix-turn-helix domain-containing protein [unclassified Desulfovibrio]|uniref:helix-turn-helix domain-containing protein n=1 Tax=unclassified Desulfovibrio TaxID=2593640 RepID=UPI0013ECF0AF|nr:MULTISPECIES: helix-turn-helix domain-containing protein [unclassified Desulfovibrio]